MDMDDYIIRFGTAKFNWKIENFCLAVRTDRNSISSPNFLLQGIPNTKWRFNLELIGDPATSDSRISISLEKLPGTVSQSLSANWDVVVYAGLKIFGPSAATFKFDDKNSSKSIDNLLTVAEALETMKPLSPDILIVKSYLVVYDNDAKIPMTTTPSGLLRLSEDLQRLKSTGKKTDIKIRIKGKCIEAHKVILSRGKIMENCINDAVDGVIEVIYFEYKAVDEYVNFLYSGDIQFILGRPTIATMKLLEHFDNDILTSYCIFEEIAMSSKIKVDTHEFHWVLNDIVEKDEFTISSPPIQRLNVDTVWQLTISMDPNRPGNNYPDHIAINADIVGGQRPRYFSVEFAIETESGTTYYPRRILRFNSRYDELEIMDFIAKRSLIDAHLAENGSVRILFRVRTSNGLQDRSMGCRSISFVTTNGPKPYEKLSDDMSKSLENEKYSDITVVCGNETFKLHKCILAARSLAFERRINSGSTDKDTLTVTDVNPDLLKEILNYIYCGVINNPEVPRLLLLYTASSTEKLDIPSLREESARILQENNIDIINKDALTVAEELKDAKLVQDLQALRVNT